MSKVQVLDFWAPWCGPCRTLTPIIDKLMEELNTEDSGVEIKKINVDEDTDTTLQYNVRSIPTLVFMKNGEEAFRMTGVQSQDKITSKISELSSN